MRVVIAALSISVSLTLAPACVPGQNGAASPATAPQAGSVECPNGKAIRPGLVNFGAYIGTWQTNRSHDTALSSDYAIGMVPGYVAVRCSNDGFVVQEEIHPRFQSPAGQALRIALTDLPDDSNKLYEHAHTGCRVFQYSSAKLAHQLGADDADGRVNIVFESDSGTYNPAAVGVILMDLYDRLGADTRGC